MNKNNLKLQKGRQPLLLSNSDLVISKKSTKIEVSKNDSKDIAKKKNVYDISDLRNSSSLNNKSNFLKRNLYGNVSLQEGDSVIDISNKNQDSEINRSSVSDKSVSARENCIISNKEMQNFSYFRSVSSDDNCKSLSTGISKKILGNEIESGISSASTKISLGTNHSKRQKTDGSICNGFTFNAAVEKNENYKLTSLEKDCAGDCNISNEQPELSSDKKEADKFNSIEAPVDAMQTENMDYDSSPELSPIRFSDGAIDVSRECSSHRDQNLVAVCKDLNDFESFLSFMGIKESSTDELPILG